MAWLPHLVLIWKGWLADSLRKCPALHTQGYLALVREVRSSRLNEMLEQTSACLATFAKRLGLAQLLQRHAQRTQALSTQGRELAAGVQVQVAAGSGPQTGNGCTKAAQQKLAERGVGQQGSGVPEGSGGSVLESSEMWAALSRALVADIEEQPRMLQGVTLRDYQMQVCARALACQHTTCVKGKGQRRRGHVQSAVFSRLRLNAAWLHAAKPSYVT